METRSGGGIPHPATLFNPPVTGPLACAPDCADQAMCSSDIVSETGFQQFVRRHEERAFRYLLSQRVSFEDSQDLCQQAFMVLWKRRHDVNTPVSFLHGTIQMLLRAHRRAQPTDVAVSICELPVEPVAPEQHKTPRLMAAERELRRTAVALLNRLPPMQRQVIEMKWIKGQTNNEIAQALRIGKNTVRRYSNEALEKLRRVP